MNSAHDYLLPMVRPFTDANRAGILLSMRLNLDSQDEQM